MPISVADEIDTLIDGGIIRAADISEIRLRAGRRSSLSLDRVNILLDTVCTAGEMASVVKKLCGGSVYAYEGSLKEGYVSPGGGVRVAVNTAVRYTGGEAVRDAVPLSLVFRIPVHTEGQSFPLARLLERRPGGMLIFAPPAEGKTTILRDLVIALSGRRFCRRVAIVDTRGEIDDGLIPPFCLTDTICGCAREEGIEWALRTLSPQVIAVDELGNRDTYCVCRAASMGVPVIATAHGAELEEMLGRREISEAFGAGAFRYLVRLTRRRGSMPEFEVVTKKSDGGIERVDI